MTRDTRPPRKNKGDDRLAPRPERAAVFHEDKREPRDIRPWGDAEKKPSRPPFKKHAGARAPQAPRGPSPFRRPSMELAVLYGYHAVREALLSPRRKKMALFCTDAAAEKLNGEIKAANIEVKIVSGDDLTHHLGRDAVHQGVLLEARPLEPIDLSEIENKSGIILVLDQVTDPHNVGAILRTAAAYNVDAIVTTERHSPDMSGVVAKAASGGLEHVPIASVVNLARALEELGEMGYQRIGLDSDGPEALEKTPFMAPVALVLGAEGKGLRRLSREKCDHLARIDMPGPVKSLNVSNACAIALTITRLKLG